MNSAELPVESQHGNDFHHFHRIIGEMSDNLQQQARQIAHLEQLQ